MGRRDYDYLTVLGVGGINQQLALADPERELADALNVYAPDGVVIARPGYVGAAITAATTSNSSTLTTIVVENPIGTFTVDALPTDLSSLAAGNRYYMFFDTLPTNGIGISYSINTTNSNSVYPAVEYWNGVVWAPVQVHETSNALVSATAHLNSAANYLLFPWPNDVSSTSIAYTLPSPGTATGYVFRVTILNGTGTTLDASTEITSGTGLIPFTGSVPVLRWHTVAQFPFTKRYITAVTAGAVTLYVVSPILPAMTTSTQSLSDVTALLDDEPAAYAIIPQFNDFYATYNYRVVHVNIDTAMAATNISATVEDDQVLIGSGRRYDTAQVSQLASWPACKYTAFFRGELWAANLLGSPYEVRWSAPQPFYRIWPTLNSESLMENDNSPITGIYGYQEHMTVFKNDSIWKMVDVGISEFTLQSYAPIRVVNGVGCTSNSSIVEIRNKLLFLSEDGVYAYNGTTQIEKLSDRINDYVKRITPGRRPFATACNWKSKSLYLLAVSLDGATNNDHVLVYDYKNDSWWVWDDIEAVTWLVDEDAADTERIYFTDSVGRVFELGPSKTSNGTAISSNILTQRLGYSHWSRKLRTVELNATNIARDATVEVMADDAQPGESTNQSVDYDFTQPTIEQEYGTATSSTTADYETDNYTFPRDRLRRHNFMVSGEWFQVKVSHDTKEAVFTMNDMQVGLVPQGRR
jgi:hypothetical protein